MKKTLSILLSILSLSIMAQVPQGVGYQGVATDANGVELVNQAISIRASVLSGSANGTIEWEETHATITDTFGLFTLTIGQGTNTTNGTQSSFADISWGTNTHYLKIEMDVTGGTNYSFMGTNQMMSVPYALYAENANINYDSISNLLSNDSTFITNVGGGIGGGCDVEYPDGIDGDPMTWDLYNNPYTVPVGKNLCITNLFSLGGNFNVYIDGITISYDQSNYNSSRGSLPYFATSGQVISSNASLINGTTFNGFLADNNVSPITWDLYNNPYTVPVGKNLYLTNLFSLGGNFNVYIDGITISYDQSNYNSSRGHKTFFVTSGQVITSDASLSNGTTLNGYLADENYFAGCGGGGSSNTGTGNMVVSTFGDTLTMNGQSIIVPGISVQNFPSSLMGSVTDFDGNTYPTIILGNQEWMAANLNTTHFANGNNLNDNSGSGTSCASQPGYKDNLSGDNFRYYNALAIHDPRNVCQTGWHVPSTAEFDTLLGMFGYFNNNDWIGSAVALKSTEPFAWEYSVTSNASMLNFKRDGIIYCGLNQISHTTESWTWTSTPVPGNSTQNIKMNDNSGNVSGNSNVMIGQNTNDYNLPIRCVKD